MTPEPGVTGEDLIDFLQRETNQFVRVYGRRPASFQLTGAATPSKSTPQDLTFFKNETMADDVRATLAGAFLIGDEFPLFTSRLNGSSIALVVRNPKLSMALCLNKFFGHLSRPTFSKRASWRAKSISRLKRGASIESGVVLGSTVKIGRNCFIGPNSTIDHCIIGDNVSIGANCSIGGSGFGLVRNESDEWIRFPHIGKVIIGNNVEIGSNVCIDRGSLGVTLLSDGCKIDNLVHVAHNAHIGRDTLVIAHAMLGGSVNLGENCWVAPGALLRNQVSVGSGALIGLGAVVVKDVEPKETVMGNPARTRT